MLRLSSLPKLLGHRSQRNKAALLIDQHEHPYASVKITSGQKALLRGLNSHEYPIVQRLSVANILGKYEKTKNIMKKKGNRLYLPWISESMADGCNKSEINGERRLVQKRKKGESFPVLPIRTNCGCSSKILTWIPMQRNEIILTIGHRNLRIVQTYKKNYSVVGLKLVVSMSEALA